MRCPLLLPALLLPAIASAQVHPPPDQFPHTTDSVWAAISAPENLVRGELGPWVRHALYVRFAEHVSQERRRQLIDSLHARVVGGFVLGRGQFHFLVFEHLRNGPREKALDALFELADEVEAHPDVLGVITIHLTPPPAKPPGDLRARFSPPSPAPH